MSTEQVEASGESREGTVTITTKLRNVRLTVEVENAEEVDDAQIEQDIAILVAALPMAIEQVCTALIESSEAAGE